MNTAADTIDFMKKCASPEKAAGMMSFFKTGKGQYAEGDKFLGIPNPVIRTIIKELRALPLTEIRKLLTSEFHEIRCCALLVMVKQYSEGNAALREELLKIYRAAAPERINNWDLVDLSAPGIVGEYDFEHRSGIAEQFAADENLWEQRIAVVSTLTAIRHGEFASTLKLCVKFLTHRHDLMHKACGWMLREVGKRDRNLLTAFLNKNRLEMPRTMLRCAIEHYPEAERKKFMAK